MNYKNERNKAQKMHNLISTITSNKKRNLIRGYALNDYLSLQEKENARKNNSFRDNMLIGAILKIIGNTKKDDEHLKRTSKEIYTMTSVTPLDLQNEIAYTIGYVNTFKHESLEALKIIKSLAYITEDTVSDALNKIYEASNIYGASNYLSYKLAFIRISNTLSATELTTATKIEDEFEHQNSEGLHYSALENLDCKISFFDVVNKRISALKNKINGNFRKAISLGNFIPTPIYEKDIAQFLLRATESSLIDTIHSIIIIFNLKNDFELATKLFSDYLNKDILDCIFEIIDELNKTKINSISLKHWDVNDKDMDISLELYRISAAFLEWKEYAEYRNKLDKVIGVRLLSELLKDQPEPELKSTPTLDELLQPFHTIIPAPVELRLDNFYRTFNFLAFIKNKTNLLKLSNSTKNIKFIFENTMGLEILLTEKEMKNIGLTAPKETKGLINVLALALFRHKSTDPDIDFEFRSNFIEFVNSQHDGSIEKFIENLLFDSPEIANYIVGSLDEVTLEKMYTLVKNASEASDIRRKILRMVGQKLNRIEYFVEADAITTRIEVSKLQQYFDSSRMYVDSVAMKNWLDSNPSVSTEQFRALNSRIEARTGSGDNANYLIIYDKSEHLISQIAKEAFEEFCTNREFGIESYLGRRIRHNTLDGVTTDTVDAVIRKAEHRATLSNQQTKKSLDTWMNFYLEIVERLKRESLQFKTSKSLFKSNIDTTEPLTKENIRKLLSSLRATGGNELLNDLIISFCWTQITPQLENAARYIKIDCLNEVNSKIDKCFTSYSNEEGVLKAELRDAVSEVFRKVSDWFQIPQTGFISASVRDLCNIILIDLNKTNADIEFSGDFQNVKYTGISVHRLYDCLAVLLQNAFKHGEKNKPPLVNVYGVKNPKSLIFDFVEIEISSFVQKSKFPNSVARINNSITETAKSSDMVTEGYSGIKKIKFITQLSERKHTVKFTPDESTGKISIGFSLHAEISAE